MEEKSVIFFCYKCCSHLIVLLSFDWAYRDYHVKKKNFYYRLKKKRLIFCKKMMPVAGRKSVDIWCYTSETWELSFLSVQFISFTCKLICHFCKKKVWHFIFYQFNSSTLYFRFISKRLSTRSYRHSWLSFRFNMEYYFI